MNGDINKISKYFDKRTPLAIQRKLEKIKKEKRLEVNF